MKLTSLVNQIKRAYILALGTILFATLAIISFYLGWNNVLEFTKPVGEVATYSRFNFALVPMGITMTLVFLLSTYFIITGQRWEDKHGLGLSYSVVGSFILAILVTLITPSIYESKYEKAGLKQCSGIHVSYLPLFGKKFAVDPSLCRRK
ncbi:DUF2079 domain-containing protein [Vibrio coralliilyticus]|uniref:DUF2079 domain-containing protein n=1 Tax=Vibrio sp. SCSIO 43145 TaxID=2819097 RepID=UPI002076641B|nr:DUF2079 domain-containing protein [Vibrio sp. SCSIO 43145]USD48251.1 DUF2079 domain-containing protein [Vibrio sp. SCSIO 43145]USD97987.1 DUF2079 domain-containing protein [Vibrio coralliilyticus]